MIDSAFRYWSRAVRFSELGYDLPEQASFFAVIASIGALGLPFSGSVENQFVL